MVKKSATSKENLELAQAKSKSFQPLNSKNKENLELAEEHIKIAEDLVADTAKKTEDVSVQDKLKKAQFDLERAEADVDQVSEEDFDEEITDE
jgi:hypothetical protein